MMDKKQLVKELLLEEKYNQLVKIASKKHNQTLKYIQMNLFEDINDPLRWYAIEAIGRLAREFGPKELEVYRNLLRRLLWAMNDESGNVPWSSPEAMASIIANQPYIFGEYTPMLITNSLDNPMCHRGMLWAAGRIGRIRNSLVLPFIEEIIPFAFKNDVELRGYAVWALGEIGYNEMLESIRDLQDDQGLVNIYKEGKITIESVGSLAQGAVFKLTEKNKAKVL